MDLHLALARCTANCDLHLISSTVLLQVVSRHGSQIIYCFMRLLLGIRRVVEVKYQLHAVVGGPVEHGNTIVSEGMGL
jgi:hypothetical protein